MAPFFFRGYFLGNKCFRLPIKNKKKSALMKRVQKRHEKLKRDMEETCEVRNIVIEEVRQVSKMIEDYEINQDLMFRILKAREEKNISEVARLTKRLREIVGNEDELRREASSACGTTYSC